MEFITGDEERKLIEFVRTENTSKRPGRNSIKRYGSKAPYPSQFVSAEIPPELASLIERLPFPANHVTVNEYRQGQAIAPHIDSKSSGEVIQILSLGSPATMRFTRKGQEPILQPLDPRALYCLQGTLRHEWQHEILPVAADRWSIVFRLGA